MTRFNMPEDVPLAHPLVSRAIEHAQGKVEGFNFDNRKHLVDYDDVLNKQRQIIYTRRRSVLFASQDQQQKLSEETLQRISQSLANLVQMHMALEEENTNEKIMQEFITIIPFDEASQKQIITQLQQQNNMEGKTQLLTTMATDLYKQRETHLGVDVARKIEQFVTLSVIDTLWMDHLDAVDNLRQGIGLRGYGQRDPLVEYKNEAFTMFEQLLAAIDDEIVHRIFKVQVEHTPHEHIHIEQNTPASEVSAISVQSPRASNLTSGKNPADKIGRNDPCPCGSGLKYKKCGLINAPQHKK